LTDQAPEVLLGAFVGEANTESFQLYSGTVNPGDLVKLRSTATGYPLQVVPVASAGDPVIGVVQRVYTSMGTVWVSVIVRGKTKVLTAGAVAAGAKIKAYGQSSVVSDSSADLAAFGTALQAAASGDTILVIVDSAGV